MALSLEERPSSRKAAAADWRHRQPPPAGHGRPAERAADSQLFHDFARTRNVEIRNELVRRNARLVRYLASRFKAVGTVSTEDLVQVGYLGLIKAIERFDPDCGSTFITVAAPTILGVIKHHLRDHTWALKVPRRVRELSTRLRRLRDHVEHQLGRAPTPAEMALAAGVTEEEILEALEADGAYFAHPVDVPLRRDGDGWTAPLQETVGTEAPEYAELQERDAVRALLRTLEPQQRMIIERRFYQECSQREVADELGISQMHVSRLERRILAHLRERLTGGEPLR